MYLDKDQIAMVRSKMAGYIGGQFVAQWATDEQVSLLVELKDEGARLHNKAVDVEGKIKHIQSIVRQGD